MSDRTRERIIATFDRELEASPTPPGLRSQTIHAAVAARRREPQPSRLLALVAVLVALALVATIVAIRLYTAPVPALNPSAPPPPRPDAAVAFDGAHGQLLVFGGDSMSGPLLADTWTWDAKHWWQQHPASSPPARMDAMSTYDAAHDVVVLFGGVGTTATGTHPQMVDLEDTWTWNGRVWTQQDPRDSPRLNYSWPATMEFDPVSRSVLLFGFARVSSGMAPETWAWNGSDWTQLTPAATPDGIGEMFSDGRHVFLSTPPFSTTGPGSHSELSEWDGDSWVPVASQNDFPGSAPMSVAFDPQRGELVVLDGDTWTWSQSRWLRQHPDKQPPTGYMTYFAPLHEVVSWGDRWGTSSNDLWGWNGSTWTILAQGTVSPSPSAGSLTLTPAAAEALIRTTVTATSPVLLPAALPPGLEARVNAAPDRFSVDYLSDQRDITISLVTDVANPPPGNASSSDTYVKFRNAISLKYQKPGYAEYFVYDPATPTSARWLMWTEPGNTPEWNGGVPYFLSTTGLTDAEFWQVADSLR